MSGAAEVEHAQPWRKNFVCKPYDGDRGDALRFRREFEESSILIDIDHTPDWLLDQRSGSFYSEEGLAKLARHLKPGGVMGLWSDARADEAFVARMAKVFSNAWSEPVTFHNPLQDKPFTQTVYLART